MRINNNLMAMNTHRQLSLNSAAGAKSIEKLSSGMRINRAGDDAAGLAISEKMRAQIRGLNQASRNGQDGISLIQTAEGALSETQSILQRMRELAVQSANDTNTDQDRVNIQKEVTQLSDELNRIGNTTEFNTRKLIDGSLNKVDPAAAAVTGTALATTVQILSAATNATMTGARIGTGAVEIHSDKYAEALGSVDISGAAAYASGENELSITFTRSDGTSSDITVVFSADTYGGASLASYLGEQINAGLSTGSVAVTLEGGTALKITGDDANLGGANASIRITGGGFATKAVTNINNYVYADGVAANNVLTLGNEDVTTGTDITISAGTYGLASLASMVDSGAATAFGSDIMSIAVGASNEFVISRATAGASNTLTAVANGSGTANNILGLANPTVVAGKDANDTFSMKIVQEDDGGNLISQSFEINIVAGSYSDQNMLAAVVEQALNTKIDAYNASATTLASEHLERLDVAIDSGKLKITNGETGSGTKIIVSDAYADLGITSGASGSGTEGTDASITFHIGANEDQSLSISIGDMRSKSLGITSASQTTVAYAGENATIDVEYSTTTVTNSGSTEYVLNVSTKAAANKSLELLDDALNKVSGERSKLGAVQNRLEHSIKNIDTSAENLQAAESRIRDVDMAKEMMDFTKNNILQQAAQAMLAQANQAPQGVLQLLR